MIRVYGRCLDCGRAIRATGRARPLRCQPHADRSRATADARYMRRRRGGDPGTPVVPVQHLTPLARDLVRETIRRTGYGRATQAVARDFGVDVTTIRRAMRGA